jgi:hypothetical protein
MSRQLIPEVVILSAVGGAPNFALDGKFLAFGEISPAWSNQLLIVNLYSSGNLFADWLFPQLFQTMPKLGFYSVMESPFFSRESLSGPNGQAKLNPRLTPEICSHCQISFRRERLQYSIFEAIKGVKGVWLYLYILSPNFLVNHPSRPLWPFLSAE